MGPNGSENFKMLLSYQSQPKVLKLVLNFPPNDPPKTMFEILKIFECPIYKDFFSKISNSQL